MKATTTLPRAAVSVISKSLPVAVMLPCRDAENSLHADTHRRMDQRVQSNSGHEEESPQKGGRHLWGLTGQTMPVNKATFLVSVR